MKIRQGVIKTVSADSVVVTLDNGAGIIKAVKLSSLDKDPKKELMEVKTGTEVSVLCDDLGSGWCIGATSLHGSGGESLVTILLDLISVIMDAKVEHDGEKPLTPGTISSLDDVKTRLNEFKA